MDYTFERPVSAVVFGPPAGGYRARAWQLHCPGASLYERDGATAVVAEGRLLTTLRIGVGRSTAYPPDHYAPLADTTR